MTRLDAARLGLLPVRFFFGFTFLWAGLDKLLDPAFLDPSAATSIHAQLIGFARASPLGALIQLSLPYAAAIGLVIAIAEIGAGIGALTGLAFRVAAGGGLALSLLFWLTASWSVHPYYFGADLPYAAGWLALAIAGHGNVLVVHRLWEPSAAHGGAARDADAKPGADPRRGARARRATGARRRGPVDEPASPERRLVLQTAALAVIATVVAWITVPLRSLGVRVEGAGRSPGPGPSEGPSPTSAATPPLNGIRVASVGDVAGGGSKSFTVPFDAPPPLPAGDPGIIVELGNGALVAFDAVCTHAGCTVEWDQANRMLVCPCHDAIFDAAHQAAVLDGPAPSPLTPLPIAIDPESGSILLVPAP